MELVVLRRLVDELDERLRGIRIEQVYALPRYHVALSTALPGRPRLWFAAEPDEPHLYLRPGGHATPGRPPGFAMAVRKVARGRRIASVSLLGGDRVVQIHWHGGTGYLIFELVPRRATALLVSDSGRVVAVWNPRRGRPGVGSLYTAPDRRTRTAWSGLDEDDARVLELQDDETLAHALMRQVEGVTPLIAWETVARVRTGQPLAEAVARELHRAENAPTQAVTYTAAPGAPRYARLGLIAPYPLRCLEGQPWTSYPDLLAAAAAFYPHRALQRSLESTRRALNNAVGAALARVRRAMARTDSPVQPDHIERLRRQADLLLAYPDAPRDGDEITLPDAYQQGTPWRVRLERGETTVQRAQKLYRRARRLERKAVHDRRRHRQLAAREAVLVALLARIRTMATLSQRDPCVRQAIELGLKINPDRLREAEAPRDASAAGPTPDRADAPLEERPAVSMPGIRRYLVAGGHTVLVGRSAAANDRLTHRIAARDDWWLHAAGPGSHVVLRNPDRREAPPSGALAAAAAIAAWFSKARQASRVQVRWTKVRYVHRRKGAPAGQAWLDRHETILATPRDPDLGDR